MALKEITIEIYPNYEDMELDVWRSAPAYGQSHQCAAGARQYGTLKNDTHRVKFAVFNATLSIELIKSIARMAIEK